ncbi:transcription initiation factor TFIID, subunit TAF5 [Viridothelium virens]|uniref:Transcription initiation factor TFIID, subunit TAF5 n=1 Tax=Viridothelium virens TaxID=1048519 RepID=A0A6A6HIN3_VIRVR|nr:transcription initiation factor TFIID, subunit TAF5 [Viridothelium virens]
MSGPAPPPGGPLSRSNSLGGPQNAGLAGTPTIPPQGSQGPGPPAGPGSQQNLNQIVLEYLNKKGYAKTESMLRRESAHQDPEGKPVFQKLEEEGGNKYFRSFNLIKGWVLDDNLEIYKGELLRLLWPTFAYCLLDLVADYYPRDAEKFFETYHEMFTREHSEDLRALSRITLPEHIQASEIAKLYRNNKYRLSITMMAFHSLLQFLESHLEEGGKIIMNIMQSHMNIMTIDRAKASSEYSISAMLHRGSTEQEMPAEDEGIPGHHPGSANTSLNAPEVLPKVQLGPAQRESDLMEDVRADLEKEDAKNPPVAGRNTLVEELEKTIKREPDDDTPNRDAVPLPPSTQRDVMMEVQKIKENRDRFPIPGRTGGVGPGVSVVMHTFHNTFDSINCIEFSGDLKLVAVGTSESYIRIWSIDGSPLPSAPTSTNPNPPPSASKRLIGHSAPVYALSFAPSTSEPDPTPLDSPANATSPRVLLSSSADKSIRLWSLDTWTCLVAYKGHDAPIWDLSWGPFGYYFASASHDRTARLWSSDHIAPLRIFAGHDGDVDCLAWHPNGSYLVTGSNDKTVRLWDVARGTPVRLFTGHTAFVTAVAVAPSGRLLASADEGGAIILWDLSSGRRLKRLRGHAKGGVWSLAWSVESSVLVSAGADHTVRVWDVLMQTPDSISAQPGSGAAGGKASADATTAGAGAVGKVGDAAPGGAGAGGQKKTKGKDVVVSSDQISVFPTKKSPVYKVEFTRMNLVMAGGVYLP